ncbi:hypothetical protein EVG80_15125 [Salmonella enterica subsp. enterica serovar Mississippi]|nr:hypothetical protein [Salmonella enterica subsp. enterica serovar Mississippi]
MRASDLTWRASEFQLNELARGYLKWMNIPALRKRRRVGAIALAMVTHDRMLTLTRLEVSRQ